MNKKEPKEYQVFKKWLRKCPYPIIPDSIKKEKSPKPDISCKLENGTSIAFELVEIIDESYASRGKLKTEAEKKFNEIFRGLCIEQQRKFEHLNILVKYNHVVSKNRKISIIPKVIEYILKKECKTGDYKPDIEGGLYSISISKQEVFSEPIFCVNDFGSVGISEFKIKEKFNKTHETPLKIELLAYHQLYFESPECLWLPKIRNFLEENIGSSPFEKVWIYSTEQNRIIYNFP